MIVGEGATEQLSQLLGGSDIVQRPTNGLLSFCLGIQFPRYERLSNLGDETPTTTKR